MKRLYQDNDTTWKEEARDLVYEVNQTLVPIVQAWMRKGYSVREICHIVMLEAAHIEAHESLSRRITESEKRKKQKHVIKAPAPAICHFDDTSGSMTQEDVAAMHEDIAGVEFTVEVEEEKS